MGGFRNGAKSIIWLLWLTLELPLLVLGGPLLACKIIETCDPI